MDKSDSSHPAPCPRAKGCPLYPQFKLKSALEMWIALYCEADFTACERYKLAIANNPVPVSLLPNGRNLGE